MTDPLMGDPFMGVRKPLSRTSDEIRLPLKRITDIIALNHEAIRGM